MNQHNPVSLNIMYEPQTPLQIDGINDNIYAGFGTRLASLLLDIIILIPPSFAIIYLQGFGTNMYFYTIIPSLLFTVWYQVYLPKRYGGTPGKLIVGIKTIRINGKLIAWREAILRDSVILG